MYDLEDMKKAVINPHLALRECNRIYHTKLWTRKFNPNGINVFEADWDTMIILDACRYDLFREQIAASLPGKLEKRQSRGSATPEFIRANFADQQLHDTIYISQNTWFLKLQDKIDVELYDFQLTPDRPITETTDAAITAIEESPNKRIVVHYIPPHHPFIGTTADEYLPSYEAQDNDLFEQIQRGQVSISDNRLWHAYKENLNRVLPEVERLLNYIDGKTVVTADHGELFGDICRPIPIADYGHHVGLYVDKLVSVPWFIHDSGKRRDISPGIPRPSPNVDPEIIDQRLHDLGYKV